MSDFDKMKGLREELMGLLDVLKLVSLRVRDTEQKLSEAEAEHNALLKMEGTMKGVIEGLRNRLRAFEKEAEEQK